MPQISLEQISRLRRAVQEVEAVLSDLESGESQESTAPDAAVTAAEIVVVLPAAARQRDALDAGVVDVEAE